MNEGVRSKVHAQDVFGQIALGRNEVPTFHGGRTLDRRSLPKLLQLRPIQVYITAGAAGVVDPHVHHSAGIVRDVRIYHNAPYHAHKPPSAPPLPPPCPAY